MGDASSSLAARASKQSEIKAKIESMGDDISAKANEQNLSREENMQISGKEARYMMMQKLARESRVSARFYITLKVLWRSGVIL